MIVKDKNAVQTLISEFNRRGIGILINQRPGGTMLAIKEYRSANDAILTESSRLLSVETIFLETY